MKRLHKTLAVIGLLGLSATAMAQKAPGTVTLDVNAFERRLQEKDESAVKELWALADSTPGFIGEGFSKWQKPLLEMKQYAVVERLSQVAILAKPFAWPAVADAQRARVEATLGLGKFTEGLAEAKRYYDLCPMSKTDDAVAYVITALNGLSPADAPAKIKRLLAEQTAEVPAGGSLAADLAPKAGPAGTLLAEIKPDATPYEAALQSPPGENAFDKLMGQGNLLLLAGRPGEAKACFRRAVETGGKGGKPLMMAVEGVARALRAEAGTPAPANAFLARLKGPAKP